MYAIVSRGRNRNNFLRCSFGGWRLFTTQTDVLNNSCSTATTAAATKHNNNDYDKSREKQQQPWLMLSSPIDPEHRFFCDVVCGETLRLLRNKKVHLPDISGNVCIGSSEGYLFSIPTCNSPEIIAVNPINNHVLNLPSTATLNPIKKHYKQEGFFKQLQTWKVPQQAITLDVSYFHLYSGKAILSPTKDTVALMRNDDSIDFARLDGATTNTWTCVASSDAGHRLDLMNSLDDCIFHKGKLYVVDCTGNLVIFDLDNLQVEPFYSYIDYWLSHREPVRKSLVESPDGNDLFILDRITIPDRHSVPKMFRTDDENRTKCFRVYKLDDNYKWNQIDSIGDLVMFVGHNEAISVNARDFPHLNPNSIYFADYVLAMNYPLIPFFIGDTGVYSMRDGSIKHFNLSSISGQKKLNWPPPIWFAPESTC